MFLRRRLLDGDLCAIGIPQHMPTTTSELAAQFAALRA